MKIKPRARRMSVAILISCLLLPQALWAQDGGAVGENPNPWAMVGDLVVARPIGLVLTAGGAVTWLVSLPFTLMAGHAAEAADILILGPGEQTFVRCLGCRNSGYTYKDIEQHEKKQAAAEAETDTEAG